MVWLLRVLSTREAWRLCANAVIASAVLGLVHAPLAPAAILYDQTGGTDGIGAISQESLDEPDATTQAADDFVVPPHEHWEITEVQIGGSSPSETPRPFNVFIYQDSSLGPDGELFVEHGLTADSSNPALPLHGVPLLDSGTYWISVQAVGLATDPWSWETVDSQHGNWAAFWRNPSNSSHTNCPTWWWRDGCLNSTAEMPDQAFRLVGTFKQLLMSGSYGNSGGVTSSPNGISCPPSCSAEFDRGTAVTLTGSPLHPNMEFAGWLRSPLSGPTGSVFSSSLPCTGIGPCQLVLDEDMTVYGTYVSSNHIQLGKVKRDLQDGSARLFVKLPAEGEVSIAGRGVEPFRDEQAQPGRLRLPLKPKSQTQRRLARTGKAKVGLRVKFRPPGNRARSTFKSVTLRLRQGT
jgi:hypothetical protein